MEFSLRDASEDDFRFLMRLRKATMTEYLSGMGVCISEEEHAKRIWYDFAHAKIVEVDGQPVGLVKSKYDSKDNHWNLAQLQIDPGFQGKTIGSRIVQKLIGIAKTTDASFSLCVLKNNPAKNLYEGLGFSVVGEVDGEHLMELSA